uniref:Coiled-coil domain containing 83 n=1 Tax=Falco tinnunculus TaxID=100819 RepID=A0A8C4UAI0_FALTI
MEEKKKEEKPEEQLKEPESAFPEALLEFQIKTKEAAIDRVLFDLKQVEKKNKEYHERNDLLKEEQQAHIRRMLRKIKEEKKKQDEKEVVTRDDVEDLLKAKWQYVKDKEQLLKEYYTNTLKAVKEENDRLLERHMELSKEQAHENALRCLDKNSLREIEENEWLKEEIKMYQKEVSDLKASINLLEEENIGLVTKLVNSRLQNLKAHRHLFLTQTAGLQDEFPKDEMKEAEYRKHAAKTDGDENLRSDTVSCQKTKAFPKIQSKTENEKPQDGDEELWEKSFTPTVDSLLYKAEEDFQEYLKLGPLETKLMCVVGRAMPIHEEPEEMPSRSHTEDGVIGKSDGHITAQMIKALG